MTELSDAPKLIRATARRVAREKVAPRAAELDESGEYPQDIFAAYRDVGLLGLSIPQEYGGSGAGFPPPPPPPGGIAKYCKPPALPPRPPGAPRPPRRRRLRHRRREGVYLRRLRRRLRLLLRQDRRRRHAGRLRLRRAHRLDGLLGPPPGPQDGGQPG